MRRSIFLYSFIALLLLGGWFSSAPLNFKPGTISMISDSTTLDEAAWQLEEEGVVRSSFLLRTLFWVTGEDRSIKFGRYLFKAQPTVWGVMRRLVTGDYGFKVSKVTIPEGSDNGEVAQILNNNILEFDKQKFLALASSTQGYLFPDTYFISAGAGVEEVVRMMRSEFDRRVKNVDDKYIRMAALLEGEVVEHKDRQIVAGILWKRLKAGWFLQVDAAPETYKKLGLPTPINNPGLDAISAAQNPVESPYWFYLTDKQGNVHYSKTFEEHKRSKAKYLNK